MIQRILNSKTLVAFALAAATGMSLYFRAPFPEANIFLHVMALRSPSAFHFLKYSYTLFLFSTPYIGYSVVLSGVYIFFLKARGRIRAGRLPLYPDPRKREELFLVAGEVHNPRKQVPAENPQWLVIPERGLFTGIAILGAIGSGKTSCCMYPFAEQILAYRAGDAEKRIGGLVLEVKSDFCHRVKKIHEAERRLTETDSVLLWEEQYLQHPRDLEPFKFRLDEESKRYVAPLTPGLAALLKDKAIQWEAENVGGRKPVPPDKKEQLEAVKRWYYHHWHRIEPILRASIVEGISVFLSLFDDNPSVKRTFCPRAECYDPVANADFKYGKPFPSFSSIIESGKVCALNFPIAMNAGLARAIGVMMKLDFEPAVLNRVPQMEAHPDRYFRQVMFICDEYQHFATVGESEPTGDEKFFSLSRQPKGIPIIATQRISSLQFALPGETWRSLLQTFRTKIFLALSDDFSARTASELCGREDKLKVSYNLSESGHDARVSLLTGKSLSHKANITASNSYNTHTDLRFDMKTFTELRNAQSLTIAYDGTNPMPPMFCYLKPYFNDPNKSYFRQLADGEL